MLKGLRRGKSADALLLMHLGCGHSLREAPERARQAAIADMSDVALNAAWSWGFRWLQDPGVRRGGGQGAGRDELLSRLPIEPGDHKVANCGYSTAG